ncbi:MAG: hypothetical protein C5B47_05360 [Verrucomicrobia bacterium]|nr:MAG: hypothetical protein C5B47_05360 [Verrucomicrobiota bacterium]
MVLEVMLRAFGVGGVNYWLIFTPDFAFNHFNLWRLLTYPLVNEPSIWFLMEMGMLYFFGKEVEQLVGRRSFGALYFVLLLPPVAIATFFWALGWASVGLAGSWNLNFAIFICFVAFYPQIEFFWGIPAKWVAIALVGIRSLELLEGKDWMPLTIFWLECLVAILLTHAVRSAWDLRFIRFGLRLLQAFYRFTRPTPKNQSGVSRSVIPIKPELKTSKKGKHELKEEHNGSIDPILEKISRSGIKSLTQGERECLERARSALLEKERRPQ